MQRTRNNTSFVFRLQFGFVKLSALKWTVEKVWEVGNTSERDDGEGRRGEHHGVGGKH